MITKKEVASKKKQGNGWIVTSWVPYYGECKESKEIGYYDACAAVRQARKAWNEKRQQYVIPFVR